MKKTVILVGLHLLAASAFAQWLHLPIMRQGGHEAAQYYISNAFGGTWPTHSYERYWALDFKQRRHWLHNEWWHSYDKPVLASASGVVVWAGWNGWYGNTVMIDHRNGYTTLYAHLNSIWVQRGQWVGLHHGVGGIGASGVAGTHNPHLHWELRLSGTSFSIDPRPHLGIWDVFKGRSVSHIW
ncbi:MAG TPA: M23 family metallopeptidase [Fimbriimonadaceae bacterium]|nr:M23 family metallopeptidase [Fimbriimonadaceae bacterium]